MNISSNDDIVGRIIQAKAKMLNECIHDVKLDIRGAEIKMLTPNTFTNLYLGRQFIVFGRYQRPGRVEIELSGNIAGQKEVWRCDAELPAMDEFNPEIERLWALSAIEDHMTEIREFGETNSHIKAVVDIATQYSIVTDYTSMLVLKEEEMDRLGIQKTNSARVQRERTAQAQRLKTEKRSYRVDNHNEGMFKGSRSHGIGSGPVGPLFVGLAYWLRRRKNK